MPDKIRLYQNQPSIKAVHAVENEMRRTVTRADEVGYACGVADMKAQGFCADPTKNTSS